MNRSIPRLVLAASLSSIACTSPEATTNTARDVPDEASASTPSASSEPGAAPIPLADRMRALEQTVYKVDVDELPAIGPATAPLTIVLFSDYQCPFCLKLEPQIAQLRAEHGSDVRLVLAPRPLPFHDRARPAALAAIAAAAQGKVEPMHRALVALGGKLDDDALTSAAREAGLDVARFEADRRGAEAERILAKAEALAKRFSVVGTPTTFLNGRRITGAVPEVVHQLGEEQLALGRGLIRQGTPPALIYDKVVAGGRDSAGPDPAIETVRVLGVEKLGDLKKCWSAPGVARAKTVELTIGPEGKVTRAATTPPELGDCVTKVASGWVFAKGTAGSTMKLVISEP
jgi:protein-disulfide isomerase